MQKKNLRLNPIRKYKQNFTVIFGRRIAILNRQINYEQTFFNNLTFHISGDLRTV
jgi:hypothetical protein